MSIIATTLPPPVSLDFEEAVVEPIFFGVPLLLFLIWGLRFRVGFIEFVAFGSFGRSPAKVISWAEIYLTMPPGLAALWAYGTRLKSPLNSYADKYESSLGLIAGLLFLGGLALSVRFWAALCADRPRRFRIWTCVLAIGSYAGIISACARFVGYAMSPPTTVIGSVPPLTHIAQDFLMLCN